MAYGYCVKIKNVSTAYFDTASNSFCSQTVIKKMGNTLVLHCQMVSKDDILDTQSLKAISQEHAT
jgi:hypothetical protein